MPNIETTTKYPRWLLESNKQPDIFEFQDFEDCKAYAEDYPYYSKKQLDRLKTIWYTIKDEAPKENCPNEIFMALDMDAKGVLDDGLMKNEKNLTFGY